MKQLKVGLVFDDSLDRPDGVQQYVLALGDWLAKKGHEVHYLVGQTQRTDLKNMHSLSRNMAVKFNQNTMHMPLPTNKKMLRDFLAQEKFDVLHVQMPYSPFMAGRLIMAASKSTAIVGTFHIMPHSKIVLIANWFLAIWLRKSLKRFTAIMSVSSAAAAFAKRVYRINSHVVPNLVDVKRFKAGKKDDHPGVSILYLGRLVPRKGCMTLLEALTKIKNDRDLPFYTVKIAGRGPLESDLKKYAIKNEIDSSVSFLGYVDESEKADLLASADIAVFPSTGGESFGIVLVEAMASGSSVVLAGDNPGYHTVMGEEPETLFRPKDSNQLAKKLSYYISHNQQREYTAKRLAKMAEKYDKPIVGEQIYKQYISALHAVRD